MFTMKAMQVPHADGAFELVEWPLPEPEGHQVRIKVEACGIFHSDSTMKEGGVYPITYPRIPGHEVIGVIDAVGKDVESWSVGQRVGVGWHGGHDFVCSACRRGDFINCENAQITGMSYDGGYAEYTLVPAQQVITLNTHLPWETLAALPETFLTAWGSLDILDIKSGQTLLIRGATSSLGLAALSFAREKGVVDF